MIDFTFVRRTIEMYLGANYSETTMVRENVETETGDEYIALRDQATSSQSLDMEGSVVRKDGLLLIDIMTPLHDGTQRSREIADILAGLIEDTTIEGIIFTESELHTVGAVEGSQYFHQVLQTQYTFLYGAEDAPCQY